MDFVRIELEKEYEKVRKDYDKCIWDGNHILNRKAGYIDDKYELEEHYYEELNEIESNLEDVDDEIDENRIIFYELSEKIENIKKKIRECDEEDEPKFKQPDYNPPKEQTKLSDIK